MAATLRQLALFENLESPKFTHLCKYNTAINMCLVFKELIIGCAVGPPLGVVD